MSEKLIYVRFRSSADVLTLYAAGIFAFAPAKRCHTKLRVVAGGDMRLAKISFSHDWQHAEQDIISFAVHEGTAKLLTDDLTSAFSSALDTPSSDLNRELLKDDVSEAVLSPILLEIVTKAMATEGVFIEVSMEAVENDGADEDGTEESDSLSDSDSPDQTLAMEPEDQGVTSVILPVKLEVSPINGTAIRKLRIGSRAYARLVDLKHYEKYFANVVSAGAPIESTIVSIDISDPKGAKLRLKLGEGVSGKVTIHPDVLVKTDMVEKKGFSKRLFVLFVFLSAIFIFGLGLVLAKYYLDLF